FFLTILYLRHLCLCLFQALTEIYTLSLHDALPISAPGGAAVPLRGRAELRIEDAAPREVVPGGFVDYYVNGAPIYRGAVTFDQRSEEHTSELQSRFDLVCRLLLEKKNKCRTTTSPS